MQIDGFRTEKCIWSCNSSNICPHLIDDRSITCTVQVSKWILCIHPRYFFFFLSMKHLKNTERLNHWWSWLIGNIWIADGGINHKCTAWVTSWAPGDRIMDSSIAVSHLLKHMLPFLLSTRRDSGSMAVSTAIEEHYKHEDGTTALFSLSFCLFWWFSMTLNSLYCICVRPGNAASNVAFGNKRNYLIFKVSYIGWSAWQHTLIISSHHGEIRLLLAITTGEVQLKLLLKRRKYNSECYKWKSRDSYLYTWLNYWRFQAPFNHISLVSALSVPGINLSAWP